jgi:hypothetical protein
MSSAKWSKEIRCNESLFFQTLKLQFFYIFDISIFSIRSGRVSGKSNPVLFGRIPNIKRVGLSGRIPGASPTFCQLSCNLSFSIRDPNRINVWLPMKSFLYIVKLAACCRPPSGILRHLATWHVRQET